MNLIARLSSMLLTGAGAKRNFNPRVIERAAAKASKNIDQTVALANGVRQRCEHNKEINRGVLNRTFTY
jgi:hypothetical protein